MGLAADPAFGVEQITVGDTSKMVDVCELADELYEAMNTASAQAKVPGDGVKESILDVKVAGRAAAAVLKAHGFPEIEVAATAYKLGSEICVRALELGKAVGDVWRSAVEPPSPDSIPASMPAD